MTRDQTSLPVMMFVCIGGNRLSVTKDGKTYFHHQTFPDEPRRLGYSLAFGTGRFVWLRQDGHVTSTDGVKWEPIPLANADDQPGSRGIWTGKEFLATGKGCTWPELPQSIQSADGHTLRGPLPAWARPDTGAAGGLQPGRAAGPRSDG